MCPRLLTPRTREELKYAVVEGADTTAHVTEWGSDAKNKKLVLFRTADVRASDCPLPFALSHFTAVLEECATQPGQCRYDIHSLKDITVFL